MGAPAITFALAAYLHDLDPFAFRFPDVSFLPAGVRWYGLSYLVGFVIGYFMIKRVVRVGVSTLKPEQVSDLVVAIAIGVMLGGRLGYIVFYEPALFTQFHDSPPFWGVLAINRGGMASHGGMIGGILACGWFARRHKHSWAHLLDLFAFAAPIGLFFGRIANFVNGELYGRPCTDAFPLAVKFPQEMHQWTQHQLDIVAGAVPDAVPSASHFIERIQAGDPIVRQVVAPFLTSRHPSQLYEAVLEGLVVFVVLAIVWLRPRKPLVIGALFCVTYGVVRIIGEFFRMPDAEIIDQEFARFGVTRGQWLSVLLAVAGLVLLVLALRRKAQPMGGWRRARETAGKPERP